MPVAGAVLTRNWLHFGRILRGLGFDAGPARMLPFLTALTVIDLYRADDLRTAVHIHFARRRDELAILDRALGAFLRSNAPEVPKKLARQVSAFIGGVRRLDLYKLPGIAETLDWTRSLIALGEAELSEAAVEATLGSIVKYQEDLERLRGAGSRELLARAVNA